jgi:hypothetical protein
MQILNRAADGDEFLLENLRAAVKFAVTVNPDKILFKRYLCRPKGYSNSKDLKLPNRG